MTNQELIANLDIDQKTGRISFEQWWAMKNAVEGIVKPVTMYDLPEPPDREAYLIEHAGELWRRVVYLQETIIRDARELEEIVGLKERMRAAQEKIGQLEAEREEVRKMRTAQKAFFKSPQGSAARLAALEDSRRLERWVDAALAPKETVATLFG